MPTIAEAIGLPPALVASATPQNPPKTMRAIRPGGAVRAGVFGSLSVVSSRRASSVKILRVAGCARNASLVPAKCNQPRCAAQHTTAGAVSERSPATQPRKKQRRNTVMHHRIPFCNVIINRCRSSRARWRPNPRSAELGARGRELSKVASSNHCSDG